MQYWISGISLSVTEYLVFALLLFCAWTDLKEQAVYDMIPILGTLIQLLYGLFSGQPSGGLFSFAAFLLLQLLLFARLYGFGDVLVFILCGTFCYTHGLTLAKMLLFMALVFLVLGITQLCRGNISRTGNLKKKVPLVPYIAICSWFLIL